ncbi:MAG: ABC transporter ATP-binding protein [Actinomycetia bacterium]|nr:ABC transporter ATP-binding protein [Actinomycetes bacterium]
MNARPLIEATNLHWQYRSRGRDIEVLRGVSLCVGERESVSVMGRSGSGKSTLLSLLSGLVVPQRGSVRVAGTDLAGLSAGARASVRLDHIGWVFQDFRLLSSLNAEQNVAIAARLAGAPKREARDRARTLLDRVGLGDRTDHPPAELSGGEQQRVGIARALINAPDVILADEPTASVDSELREGIEDLLFEVAEESALLIVTHDPVLAARTTRHVRLESGLLLS